MTLSYKTAEAANEGNTSAAHADAKTSSASAGPRSQAPPVNSNTAAFQAAGLFLNPTNAFVWLLGVLGVAACVAPWVPRGWLWLSLMACTAALLGGYDGLTLWLAREEFSPVLLRPERGLRGREGQNLQLPLAFARSTESGRGGELRVAVMPATREAGAAMEVKNAPERLKLQAMTQAGDPSSTGGAESVPLWPWTPEIRLLHRGLWPIPRVGIERRSRFGFWRLSRWFDSPSQIRIDADLRPGRRDMLRSPIYRAMVAARQTPWTGHGRDFERLREYQPGDNYSEIAWKSTARRGTPVTRLFQWEQKQEVYFLVDQSRASALVIDEESGSSAEGQHARAPRRLLDVAIETALVGATVALEMGDEFGLVTYADEPTSWLRAGSGQFQFQRFRDHLQRLEPLPTSPDYEKLFGEIRLRLRRRAYLVLLANLADRSISDSLRHGVGLVRSAHVVLMTSILPAHARPAFSAGEEPQNDQDVYAALASEKENQRLAAAARQLRHLNVDLRFVAPGSFLRTAVEGYLQSKREQRV